MKFVLQKQGTNLKKKRINFLCNLIYSQGIRRNRSLFLKILQINFTETKGGAGRVASRLDKALLDQKFDSKYYVARKQSQNETVIQSKSFVQRLKYQISPRLDRLPLKIRGIKNKSIFSNNVVSDSLIKDLKYLKPDIINLHWINAGFIKIETLQKIDVPLVWTMHDQWPFTGGCHYFGECKKYEKQCGCCPVLNSDKENDLSRKNWLRKKKSWADIDITLVSPSKWLGEKARKSSLFKNRRIEVIPNGIDTEIFKGGDKKALRKKLSLPENKKVILFCGSKNDEDRKGVDLLTKTLMQADEDFCNNTSLLILGSVKMPDTIREKYEVIQPGYVDSEKGIAEYYSASNICLLPSKQDNLPNTVLESLACGTPVVAFDIGGIPDMIDHKKNGYLAQPYSSEGFFKGIYWCLNQVQERLSENARNKAMNFSIQSMTKRYLELYEDLQ